MRCIGLLGLVLVAGGCVRVLPPVATPAPVVPDIGATTPPPAGQGRAVIDVVDGPTEVRRVVDRTLVLDLGKGDSFSATTRSTSHLCTTPCVADMPPGHYMLTFPSRGGSGRLELDTLDVGTEPTVYRRALGSYDSAGAGLPLGIVSVSLGGASFVTGAALFPVGLANDDRGMGLAGGITLAVGALFVALGIYAIEASPATEQPGASIQFPLPTPAGASAPAATPAPAPADTPASAPASAPGPEAAPAGAPNPPAP